jgi:hypothetical protein
MSKSVAKKGPTTQAPASVKKAEATQEKIVKGCEAIRTVWIALAGHLHDFFAMKMWKELGYETFNDWLATPEIDLGRTQVYTLIEAYQELVIERGVDAEELVGLDVTKIAVVLPAIRSGEVSLDDALADCKVLSRSDLREKYGQQLPDKSGEGAGAGGKRELVQCADCGKMREADGEESCDPIPGQEEIDLDG